MTDYLITGVSTGIGRVLTKELIDKGHRVLGIARREKLLLNLKEELNGSKKFNFIKHDIAQPGSWNRIASQMRRMKFLPQVVIFNAAILDNDLSETKLINLKSTNKIFETNFFSNLRAINELIKLVKPKTKFIFIGSSSAFKGSGEEGIGYSASKAALNSAFESLHQRFGKTYDFKIIHFGPVKTAMVPFNSKILFMRTPEQAAMVIINAIDSNNHIFYFPQSLFIFLRFIKLLPSPVYLWVLNLIDSIHQKNQKKPS